MCVCSAGLTITAGFLCGLVTLSVRLSVSVLLSMLQTELMAHFKSLTHRPYNTHGLSLKEGGHTHKKHRVKDKSGEVFQKRWIVRS